jgi:5-bromo-4-chloroindolyl phosphate hydrolysis protein
MGNAKRYDPTQDGKRPFFIKGILLYILTLPLIFALFFALLGGHTGAILSLGIATALYLLGATVARKGFLAEREYNKSILAKAPKLKYKTVSAIILAFATFYTSFFTAGNGMILSIILAIFFMIGFYLYYGFDPVEDKVGELGIGVTAEEVIEITGRAKKSVDHLKKIRRRVKDTDVESMIDSVVHETEDVIKAIEKDPNDLSKARKFFNVYLHRTEEISKEYLKNLENENIDETLRENFKKLLRSVTETIHEQKARLDEDDITRLDIQIEALTKQLKNEGV